MKKVSNSKKQKKKNVNENRHGFTLIELLATIAILSVILSIVVYFIMDVVDNANDKSYQVTINNIEKNANSYVLEGLSSTVWIDSTNKTYQYQCVTVQNLIDAGYFKGDVLNSKVDKNTNVEANHYIYLERDIDTKTVTKNVLLVGNMSTYMGLCSNITASGNINFIVKPSGWAHEKEITIYYTIYNNLDSVANYKYDYNYILNDDTLDKSLSKNFTNIANQEDVTVTKNGTLIATIKDKDGKEIVNAVLNITGIDNDPPVVEILSTNNVADKQTVTLNMDDMGGSGVDKYYFGKENPEVTDVEWIDVTDNDKVTTTDVVDSEGTWYLGAKDVLGNEVVISQEFYKTTLSINNGSVTPSEIITMKGNSFTIPNASPNTGYAFIGWYKADDYSGDKVTIHKPESNSTLYGKIVKIATIPIASNNCNTGLVYNGNNQTLTKNTSSLYTLSGNVQKNAGTYTVTAKLSGDYVWDDGTTSDKTFKCSISKATPSMTVNPSSLTLIDSTGEFSYTYNGDGQLSCSSSNTSVATCSLNTSTKKVTVTPGNNGNVKITLSAAAGTNYSATSKDVSVNVGATYTISYNANGGTGTMSNTECIYGQSCSISANGFSRTNYKFIGWTTKSDGSDDGYNWTNWSGTWSFENGDYGVSNYGLVLYARWQRVYQVNITYKVNSGTIASSAGGYTWTTDSNGVIYRNGSVLKTTLNYGTSLGDDGLVNYNNTNYVNISRSGYSAVSGAEWKCLSGCTTSGATFSHSSVYDSDDFCDASSSDCNVVLGVNWIGNEYTITYITNGGYSAYATDGDNDSYCAYEAADNHDISGTMAVTKCRYGSSCTLRTNGFSRTCHKFMGWTTNSDTETTDYTSNVSYTDAQKFTYDTLGNITLYAVWKTDHNWNAIGVQLTDTGGMFECGHEHTVAYGRYCSKCHMSVAHYNQCYRKGYEDKLMTMYCPCAWQSVYLDDHARFNSSGSKLDSISTWNLWSFGGTIEEKTKFSTGSHEYVCTEHYHTITFNKNGGSSVSPTSKTVSYNSAVGTLPTPIRTGYNFTGWNTKSDGSGDTYTSTTTLSVDSDITLYAQWAIKTYTVSYNANGGSGAPASQTKTYGVDLTLSSTVPTKTGYSFSGWNTYANGNGTSYSKGGKYTSNSSVTLYAQWTAKTYTVTLNKQSGTGGTSTLYGTYNSGVYTNSARTTKMTTTTNNITVPTRTGYTFGGYYTSTGGSGTQLIGSGGYITSSFTTTKYSSNVTLYAKWTANKYTITLDKQSGSGGTSTVYLKYGSGVYTNSGCTTQLTTSANAISVPTRSAVVGKYTFNGYYTQKNGGGKQMITSTGYKTSSFTSTQFTANTTLYASWTYSVW